MRKFKKDSIDYQINLVTLREMEEMIPMIKYERDALRRWAKSGHDIATNPWQYTDAYGCPLDYLKAFRVHFGFSRGPTDYWDINEWYSPWYSHNENLK